jgi:hypothetical protein
MPAQQYRPDGWPYCPRCEADELASIVMLGFDGRGEPPTLDECFRGDFFCYGCRWAGKVEREVVK